MNTDVLTIEKLGVRFGGNEVLPSLSLRIGPGFTGLVGPNGAGKTTVFNAITGYVRPFSGRVLLGERPLPSGKPVEVARLGVRRSFQTPRLVPDMSVLSNVLMGLDSRLQGLSSLSEFFGLSNVAQAAAVRARELLDAFGLGSHLNRPVSSLPLGSQKIVEVARALASKPRVVLLDEPAAGLSASDVDRLVEPLATICKADGFAVIIIEHDLELVSRLCPRVLALHFGRIVAEGTPSEVFHHPDVVESYVGGRVAAHHQ